MKTKQIGYLMLCSRDVRLCMCACIFVFEWLWLCIHITRIHTVKRHTFWHLHCSMKARICSKTLYGMRLMLQCRQHTEFGRLSLCWYYIDGSVHCTQHSCRAIRNSCNSFFVSVVISISFTISIRILLYHIFFPTSHVYDTHQFGLRSEASFNLGHSKAE